MIYNFLWFWLQLNIRKREKRFWGGRKRTLTDSLGWLRNSGKLPNKRWCIRYTHTITHKPFIKHTHTKQAYNTHAIGTIFIKEFSQVIRLENKNPRKNINTNFRLLLYNKMAMI